MGEEDKEKKSFDKTVIQCYNFQRYGHFAYECRNAKKPREDRAYVAETTPVATSASASSSNAVTTTSSLLMAVVEEVSDLLLHGSEGASFDPTLWYLDTRATNHMTGC